MGHLAGIAKHGDIETIKFAIECGAKCSNTVAAGAVVGNKIENLKYLHSIGCDCGGVAVRIAASKGHFECLKFLHDNGYRLNNPTRVYDKCKRYPICAQFIKKHYDI